MEVLFALFYARQLRIDDNKHPVVVITREYSRPPHRATDMY
jgi:hypothetical protein